MCMRPQHVRTRPRVDAPAGFPSTCQTGRLARAVRDVYSGEWSVPSAITLCANGFRQATSGWQGPCP